MGDSISIIVLSPSFVVLAVAVYGFMGWSGMVSLTSSKLIPVHDFIGFDQYVTLWSTDRWHVAVRNLAIFAPLFIGLSTALGLVLAIFLDQKIRAENVIRSIYLYPMAISFIVTGTAWKWILNPGLGVEKLLVDWGFEGARFDWIVDPQMAVFTLVIAAVWQSTGFAMAIFLAGLRSIDGEVVKAARIDGAGLVRIYWSIILPMLRPVFLTVVVILMYQAVRSFDLVVALTGGGPGYSSDLPANFMYQTAFSRNRMGLAAASAMMILMTIAAVMIPYIYSELRQEARHEQ
ncbi:carbohydrate ABC transporter permease [Nitratireductor sp. ZSWI3]|uniref:carbohydrate ABC transporter permease n=1 Tax=Nitratireductor sp. ZSWI3 TaxID=2966359 RepID=UPI00214FB650|nr:sugar ABC transporter permease [Nitratireductor sp. ZSWI3]MCR4265827.1 sugar ABC transporter permease [Nitratireductor sp. ZSWI3]